MSHERFQSCIDACIACAIACEHCASECLKEEDVKMMVRCIELDRECASVCRSAAELMSIGGSARIFTLQCLRRHLRSLRTRMRKP